VGVCGCVKTCIMNNRRFLVNDHVATVVGRQRSRWQPQHKDNTQYNQVLNGPWWHSIIINKTQTHLNFIHGHSTSAAAVLMSKIWLDSHDDILYPGKEISGQL